VTKKPPPATGRRRFFDRAAASAAEFDQIAGDVFVHIAGPQAGAELRQPIGKERDAANFIHIPPAAMLKSSGHPTGVAPALRRALFITAPEQFAFAAIRRALGPGDPAPFAGRGLAAAEIGDVGIAIMENPIQDQVIFCGVLDCGEVTGMSPP